MSRTLRDKVVVILGGSSGIGLATALAAQADGAEVVITGRDAKRLAAAKERLGGSVRTGQFDAAHENPAREFFNSITTIDHIFSTAGTLAIVALKVARKGTREVFHILSAVTPVFTLRLFT